MLAIAPTAVPNAAPVAPTEGSFTFAFNPPSRMPGAGARQLTVEYTRDATGNATLSYAKLGPSFQLQLPVPRHVYRAGNPTTPRLQGSLDALASALPTVLPALQATPSEENDVDNGFGWANNGTFALMTGAPGFEGTGYYYGRFGHEGRPAVAHAATLLDDLAESLRADA